MNTAKPAKGRVAELLDGPIDIVGDVQGELELLRSLLRQLGYETESAAHPEGRRLAFVGDLVDRGPDSAGVLERVMGWVDAGRAQCILGNHELDILRGKERPEENGWFFAEVDTDRKAKWRAFMDAMPAALERADLRVVHACWSEGAIARVAAWPAAEGYREAHRRSKELAEESARICGVEQAAAAESTPYAEQLRNATATVPLLAAVARRDALVQNENPIKVLTSGREMPAREPKFIAGAWRMTDQERWWNDYRGRVPVVIGHYRRAPAGVESASRPGVWDYVFDEYPPYAWLGPDRNVMCVDYSGTGYEAPRREQAPAWLRLAALRWPECELVFDDGERLAVAWGKR